MSRTFSFFRWINWIALALVAGFLAGCSPVTFPGASVETGRELFIGVMSFFIFLATLIYAGYKAFIEPNSSYHIEKEPERRARALGFVIGILITVIIIAADSESGPFSTVGLLALFPWYLFAMLSGLAGFAIAVASFTLAQYRPTSGVDFIILVLTFAGGLGIYLTIFATGFRDNALVVIASLLVGLLSFRMLFPAVGESGSS